MALRYKGGYLCARQSIWKAPYEQEHPASGGRESIATAKPPVGEGQLIKTLLWTLGVVRLEPRHTEIISNEKQQ